MNEQLDTGDDEMQRQTRCQCYRNNPFFILPIYDQV
jgi:hypothetical protein